MPDYTEICGDTQYIRRVICLEYGPIKVRENVLTEDPDIEIIVLPAKDGAP
ncbi:hypothetical protein [Salipiger profundus]|uniref:hypothetical protein n=1 Tax=Salipiger profundus TaxID=1229727 RepID=UPI0008E9B369|nr:hypothetical protein [Salipiger profundus]SFC10308.1 hypothetical protein SAMN05444415_102111 [Salipiger profundus]